jgi:hypothetical protein
MTIKQSAPFGLHSSKGLAATAPPVVSNGSPSCWWIPTKHDKSGDSNQLQRLPQSSVAALPVLGRVRKSNSSPSCWRSWKKAAMAATAPQVVGDGSPNHRWSWKKVLEEEVPTELKVLLTLSCTLTSFSKHTTEDPAPGCPSRRRSARMI